MTIKETKYELNAMEAALVTFINEGRLNGKFPVSIDLTTEYVGSDNDGKPVIVISHFDYDKVKRRVYGVVEDHKFKEYKFPLFRKWVKNV